MVNILTIGLRTALERGRGDIWRAVSDRNNTHRRYLCWNAKQLAQNIQSLQCGNACKPCRQSLMDNRQQEDHDGAASIHVPERDGPADLGAIFIHFIRLLIATMIGCLAGTGYYKDRSFGNEGVKTTFDVGFFVADAGNRVFKMGLCNHNKRLALCETGAGSVPRQFYYSLDHIWRNRFRGEVPDHAPFEYYLAKFHVLLLQ